MTEKKTLKLNDPSEHDGVPNLNKKGRGWEISSKRLDGLHDRAREMRRHSSEAHKVLAKRFAEADLGHYAFKRFPVIGSAIVDFGCHNLGMAIAIIDGEATALDKRRDESLKAVGIRIMRIQAADILDDMDEVLSRVTEGMRMRIADKKQRIRDNNSQPRREGPRRASSRAPSAEGGYEKQGEKAPQEGGSDSGPDSGEDFQSGEDLGQNSGASSDLLAAYSSEAPEDLADAGLAEEAPAPAPEPEPEPETAEPEEPASKEQPENGNDDA